MFRLIAVVSAAVAAALMVAGPAQADDQSYLNYLEAHGQSTTAFPYSPGSSRRSQWLLKLRNPLTRWFLDHEGSMISAPGRCC
jgi:poly(3-hydroxybutyrate) depolymerase